MEKLVIVLFLGWYIPMEGTVFTCNDCFVCVLCQVTLFLLASICKRKLLAKDKQFWDMKNGPCTHVIVATSFVDRQVKKSC